MVKLLQARRKNRYRTSSSYLLFLISPAALEACGAAGSITGTAVKAAEEVTTISFELNPRDGVIKNPDSSNADASYTVLENTNANDVIVDVGATADGDVNLDTIFTLEGGDKDRFDFNQQAELSFKENLDFEAYADDDQNNIYKIRFTATKGSYQAVYDLSIHIANVNEAPTDIDIIPDAAIGGSGQTLTIAENALAHESGNGYLIGTISVVDPDEADISFPANDLAVSDDSNFFINADNKLYLKVTPTAGQDYSITIIVNPDLPALTYTEDFSILVVATDEAPTIEIVQLANGAFAEASATAAETVIASFELFDADGDDISFSLEGEYGELFELVTIDNSQRQLRFKSSPDFESLPGNHNDGVYSLEAIVHSTGSLGQVQSASQSFTVTISDVNEAPTDIDIIPDAAISGSGQTFTIAENALADESGNGYLIGTIDVQDPDGENSGFSDNEVRLTGSDAGNFQIIQEANIYRLYLTQTPNRETKADYSISIATRDEVNPDISYSKDFVINVTNINEPPFLSGDGIVESGNLGLTDTVEGISIALASLIGEFSDPENNIDKIIFDITTTGNFKLFYKESETAIEEQIIVDNNNLQSLSFTAGFVVGTIRLAVSDTASGLTEGVNSISYSVGDEFGLTSDSNQKASISFELENITDNVPVISITAAISANIVSFNANSNTFTINEGDYSATSAIGVMTLGTITAEDPDPTNPTDIIIYSIVERADSGSFGINSDNGLLTLGVNADYEAPDDAGEDRVYDVRIRAQEVDGVFSTIDIKVIIANINDAPTSIDITAATGITGGGNNFAISESAPADESGNGYLIGTISINDPDTLNREFSDNNLVLAGDDSEFFEIIDNKLYLKSAPNYETTSSYSISITAADANNTALTTGAIDFTITVVDVNEAPTVDIGVNFGDGVSREEQSFYISEFAAEDSSVPMPQAGVKYYLISDVAVTDPDTRLVFSDNNELRVTGTDAQSFEIIAGKLYLKSTQDSLDYETISQTLYSIDLTATDADANTQDHVIALTIEIEDEREAADGITITALGDDVETVGGNPYEFRILDSANIAAVDDVPVGQEYYLIGDITVSDPDTTDTNTVSIFNQQIFKYVFAIIDGRLYMKTPLIHGFSITIVATDTEDSSLRYEQEFTIGLERVNDAPTDITINSGDGVTQVFGAQTFELLENTAAAAAASVVGGEAAVTYYLIGDVVVTDPDQYVESFRDNNLVVSDETNFFISDDDKLYLKFERALDYETVSQRRYSISISATDATNPDLSYVEDFIIDIGNLDEAPSITSAVPPSGLTYEENVAARTQIGAVFTASDPDGDAVSLALADDYNGLFAIDSAGVLRFKLSPDFETLPSGYDTALSDASNKVYSLIVTAVSTGSSSLESQSEPQTFNVTITDLDEPPSITSVVPPSGLTYEENVAARTQIGTVFTASDPEGDAVSFALADDYNGLFAIDSAGVLRFTRAPDYETPSGFDANANLDDEETLLTANTYSLTVIADSTGSSGIAKQNSQTFNIMIIDVNERPTDISLIAASGIGASDNIFTIAENTIADESGNGYLIGAVAIEDPDVNPVFRDNSLDITGEDSDAFTIVSNNLYLTQTLDYDIKPSYAIRIVANMLTPTQFESPRLTVFLTPSVYVWARGDEDETIAERLGGTVSVLRLTSIDIAEVDFLRNAVAVDGGFITENLALTISDFSLGVTNGGVVTLSYAEIPSATGTYYVGVDRVHFDINGDGVIDDDELNLNLFYQHQFNYGVATTDSAAVTTAGTDDADLIIGFNIEGAQDSSDNYVRDYIEAGAGDDYVYGLAGDDRLNGGAGDDTLYGGAGNDRLYGEADDDTLYGGAGDDFIIGGAGDDTIYGGANIDTINGGAGNDIIYGEAGNDFLFGGADDDTLNGGAGNDFLDGRTGQDNLFGNEGADFIYGGAGDDSINGGVGNDIIYGEAGNDFLFGGADDDTLNGGAGDDTIYGGANIDTINGGTGIDTIHGGAGGDFIIGGAGDDTLYGGANIDTINGGIGNDTIYGGADNDILDGRTGQDNLFGNEGADFIYGGADNDIINGGAGNDYLYGNEGNDSYIYSRSDGHDRITELEGDGDMDYLFLQNFNSQDVESFKRWDDSGENSNGNNLKLIFKETAGGGSLMLQDSFNTNSTGVDAVIFDINNNSIWDDGDIAWADEFFGTMLLDYL